MKLYILGVSFGGADLEYFKYIFLKTNASKLYLHVYKDNEYLIKENIVKRLCYEGDIINWKLSC